MRIALITEVPRPLRAAQEARYPGGPGGRTGALAAALAGLGAEVTVHGPESPGTGPGIRAFADQLAGRWRRAAPDVVHAQSWPAWPRGPPGRDLPAVQTLHPVPSAQAGRERARDADPNGVELALARSARAVLVGTTDAGSALRRFGVPRASIRIVPDGVDTTRFTPAGPAAPRGSRPRLLVVGGLADDPGPVTAVRALPDVPEAELVIAGGPPASQLDADPGYQALMRLAGELGVGSRVSFTGQVSLAGMPALMRSAELLLNLGTDDEQGMVTVEAMACGVPVVAAETGLHADAVINGTTGLLLPPGLRGARPPGTAAAGQPDAGGHGHRRGEPGRGTLLVGPDRPGDPGRLRGSGPPGQHGRRVAVRRPRHPAASRPAAPTPA